MISILLSVIGLFAVFAWIVAVMSAIRIVRLAPKGAGMRTYGRLGWWKFDAIRQDVGLAADPHITAYQRAFVAFMLSPDAIGIRKAKGLWAN